MLVECHHCGAPLDIKGSERFAKCKYCDHTNLVRSMKTVSMQTPPQWQPPQVWSPPAHLKAHFRQVQVQLRYHEVPAVDLADAAQAVQTASKVGCVVTASIGLLVAVIAGAAVFAVMPRSIDDEETPQFGAHVLGATGPSGRLDFTGMAMGEVSGWQINSDCRGYVSEAPQVVLEVRQPTQVRIDARGTADGDAVLLMRGADGSVRCDDDSGGDRAARLDTAVAPGRYSVWVGMFSQNSAEPYTLGIVYGSVQSMPDARGVVAAGPPTGGTVDLTTMPAGGRSQGVTQPSVMVNTWGSGCTGYIPVVPHLHVRAAEPTPLNISAVAEGNGDLVLVTQDANGTLRCNDDRDGRNPGLSFAAPAGVTSVWVGLLNQHHGEERFRLEVRNEAVAAAGLVPEAPPMLGVVDLDRRDTGVTMAGETGGGVRGDGVDRRCHGYFPEAPHLAIQTTRRRRVRIETTGTTEDLTMLVRDPDGDVRCDDDSGGASQPRLDLNLPRGTHHVWIGRYSQGATVPFSLRLVPR